MKISFIGHANIQPAAVPGALGPPASLARCQTDSADHPELENCPVIYIISAILERILSCSPDFTASRSKYLTKSTSTIQATTECSFFLGSAGAWISASNLLCPPFSASGFSHQIRQTCFLH